MLGLLLPLQIPLKTQPKQSPKAKFFQEVEAPVNPPPT